MATSNGGQTKVYTIHSLPDHDVDTRVRALPALSEVEARDLTTQIQRTTARLWMLVTEAHDRKAHVALGYETWADYVKAELRMSESRSYQFLDTGHVMKALAASGVDIESVAPPPTRVIARIKDRLTDVKKVVAKAGGDAAEIDKGLRALAREPRKKEVPEQREPEEADVGAAAEAAETPSARRAAAKQVSCPACAGTGKVTQAVADRLLAAIAKMKT